MAVFAGLKMNQGWICQQPCLSSTGDQCDWTFFPDAASRYTPLGSYGPFQSPQVAQHPASSTVYVAQRLLLGAPCHQYYSGIDVETSPRLSLLVFLRAQRNSPRAESGGVSAGLDLTYQLQLIWLRGVELVCLFPGSEVG